MGSPLYKPASRPSAAVAAALLVIAFVVPSWALILTGFDSGRGAADQNSYHLKAIERFSAQWPGFDFTDYESATTPGYHLVLAAVHRFWGDGGADLMTLRLAGSLFTAGFFATLGWVLARRAGVVPALALGAPLVASLYVFSAGAWLLPDNAAWWGVLAILLIALRPRFDPRVLIGASAVLLVLVLVRQIHLWAAALLWLSAWLGSGPNASALTPLDLRNRLSRTALAFLATIPGAAMVIWFMWLWEGPVPKMFQGGTSAPGGHDVTGANPATPALILALIGIFGTFYAALLWPALRAGLLGTVWARLALAGSVVLGAAVAAVPLSTYSVEQGRWSGLWNIVRFFDGRGVVIADRSPLIIGLAILGAAWLAIWSLALNARDRWMFLGAWVAFIVAQSTTHFSWQRYHEPFILIMLAIFATRLPGTGSGGWARSMTPPTWAIGAWAGPLVLALLLGAITVLSLR